MSAGLEREQAGYYSPYLTRLTLVVEGQDDAG